MGIGGVNEPNEDSSSIQLRVRLRRMAPKTTAPDWTADELLELAELEAANDALPEDALRGLLSVRLSVLTEETTSLARQELDLRRHSLREGIRLVGVARDLGVSATKKAPYSTSPQEPFSAFWATRMALMNESMAASVVLSTIETRHDRS